MSPPVPLSLKSNGVYHSVLKRADGGYVIAPPSNHEKGVYRWAEGRQPNEIELAELPPWLLELLPRKDESAPATSFLSAASAGQQRTNTNSAPSRLRLDGRAVAGKFTSASLHNSDSNLTDEPT